MEHNSPAQISFVKNDNITTIVCPSCYTAKTASVKQFRDRKNFLKVKCKCGHTFKLELEFRRQRRKTTKLDGTALLNSPDLGDEVVKIVNLSMSGACFEVLEKHNIQIGQKGSINFTLDDPKQTPFVENVIVRSIQGNLIGCEFTEDRAYQRELGFYLRP
jgi:hypothetical protein